MISLAKTLLLVGCWARATGLIHIPLEASSAALGVGGAGAILLARRTYSLARINLTPELRSLPSVFVRPGVGAFGVGLIAVRPVPKGQKICDCAAKASTRVPEAWLVSLDPAVRRVFFELFDGLAPDGKCCVPTDYDQSIPIISFLNHSPTPNCRYDERKNAIVAARRLRRGEEATVDYIKYQEPGSYTYREAADGFSKPRTIWPL